MTFSVYEVLRTSDIISDQTLSYINLKIEENIKFTAVWENFETNNLIVSTYLEQ